MPKRPALLLTGLNGSLAPSVARAAASRGFAVLAWDRSAVPPTDTDQSQRYLDSLELAGIVHMAMGSADWAAQLAGHSQHRQIPMVFTSTAMVFDHVPDGPHHVGDPRTAKDDYGRYKIDCEDRVRQANPQAMVVRLGWQIDPIASGNNMLMALDQWQAQRGCVAASRSWRPACSFMQDTATALLDLLQSPAPGVHHLDSNATEGHSFMQIARALQQQFQRNHWDIQENNDYQHDQRLLGGPKRVPPLSYRLPTLAG